MTKKKVLIIQNKPTQFDTGLFEQIKLKDSFSVTMHYTRWDVANIELYDPEINRNSGWSLINNEIETLGVGINSNYFVNIYKMLFVRDFDLVIISGYSSLRHLYLLLICKLLGFKVGLRADTVLKYDKGFFKLFVKKTILSFIYKFFNFGFPVSTLSCDSMKKLGMTSESLFYFPYGIDEIFIETKKIHSNSFRLDWRKKLSINESDFVTISVIKFVPREDPFTVLKAFEVLVESSSNIHLILVGDGYLMNEIKEFISARNLVTRITLTGYLSYNELIELYFASDIFLHPANIEQWGVSVHEAILCDLPVIVSDGVGSAVDLINSGISGLVYRSGDYLDLIEKVVTYRNFTEQWRLNAIHTANVLASFWTHKTTVLEIERCLKLN